MKLEAFGWSSERQAEFAPHAAEGLVAGRVVGEHRSHFQVATDAVELSAELTGRLRKSAAQRSDLAGVGDFVAMRLSAGDGNATIEDVLPRTSALIRKASGEDRPQLLAANVDAVFIVTAPDGDFNLPRIERLLALVADSSATPVIVLNKSDLTDDVAGTKEQIGTIAPGVPVDAVSARASDGIAALERYFYGNRTIGLIGSSGVGKSTLTNALLGRAAQATQEVRAHDSRGRHTTTHRQLFLRPRGGAIIDTPGMRGVELWNAGEDADGNFDDIETLALACKFRNCRHDTEPACAVRAAVGRGELEADRVARYVKLARRRTSAPGNRDRTQRRIP
jgi:ribosome biogenesis GTPase / thiamine phosphate phosphatase